MLEYNEALEKIVSSAVRLPVEKVNLPDSLNRILATDVIHDRDMPPFNKSSMDGFACRKADLKNELEVVEILYAGKNPEKKVGKNQCVKIMTGAVVPPETDFVFRKEDAEITKNGKVVCNNLQSENYICYRGEDIREGEIVLNKSVLLTPRHLPVLAGAGITKPTVYVRPSIAVFATGTELVEPGQIPKPFQIRNSNSSQLLAQIKELGMEAIYGGVIQDEEKVLLKKIGDAFDSKDLVILTGGVSVGEFDFIPDVLQHLGFEILISATAIKPGKPMVFARKENKYCFGLSGNPVSSFVQFIMYVKPFLYALMGHSYEQKVLTFPLGKPFYRNKAERMNLVPAILNDAMEVIPVEFHSSAHINALSGAGYLCEIPIGVTTIEKGEQVNVRPL
jgi:molybdopterin molybdotransferase